MTGLVVAGLVALLGGSALDAHVVPPETLHPVAESYRRLAFVLAANPVDWELARRDASVVTSGVLDVAPREGHKLAEELASALARLETTERAASAGDVFQIATTAVATATRHHVLAARVALPDSTAALRELDQGRQIYAAIEPILELADPAAYRELGQCWLAMASAVGNPGVLGRGSVEPDLVVFEEESGELVEFLSALRLDLPQPRNLPPGSNINKQLPRPRQVLNMAVRGIDERETTLIALGDMAFDSPFIFGEPARSLGISCNSCHNKSVTNPDFFIPGLSARPGGMDVSNNFFAPHANNGHFDHLDTPDLRGIRFTAPYGRNGRFASLREFVRNVVVNEFNGAEPKPLLLDGMIAYMLEFDFLPNSKLNRDGTLNEKASAAARRGEKIFDRPFPQMAGRSCSSCHLRSDHFLDRKRHDIGSVAGAENDSRDGALDTPTLLSSLATPPYFHDGSLPTLEAVNQWFNSKFELGLSASEIADLTAYLETVGDGDEAYEDSVYTLAPELEEFSFFLSTYEFLKQRDEAGLIDQTLATVAFEIEAHKWDVQDPQYLPLLDQLSALVSSARSAYLAGDVAQADARIAEYRELYETNIEVLK